MGRSGTIPDWASGRSGTGPPLLSHFFATGPSFLIGTLLAFTPFVLGLAGMDGPRSVSEKFKVVVVEDNQDAAASLRMILELCGFEVAVAHTGPQGIELAKTTQPDAVVCDIGLPGIDGYGVARTIRDDESLANTRLIALTGYHQDDFRRLAFEAGFDRHMVKPADLVTLLDWLPKRAV